VTIEKLKEESMDDYIDLLREFEMKKLSITSKKAGKTFQLPFLLESIVMKYKSKSGIQKVIANSKYSECVTCSKQKLHILNDTFRDLFKSVIDNILTAVSTILYNQEFNDVHKILMVGGFSDCELLQNAMRKLFYMKRLIIPDEADLAVLKGAVLFGHVPRTISGRISRRTYGIKGRPVFDPYHDLSRTAVSVDRGVYCKDAFLKYVEKGEELFPGFQKSRVFKILETDKDSLELAIYWSENKNPVFIEEKGCYRLGILTVPLDRTRTGPIEIEQTMIFGETELIFKAKDIATGRVYDTLFDFLDTRN